MPANPHHGEAALGSTSGPRSAGDRAWLCPSRELGIPRVAEGRVGGTTAEMRRAPGRVEQGPPPTPTTATWPPAGDQRPLPRSALLPGHAPPRHHPRPASTWTPPNGRAAGARVTGALLLCKYKGGKRRPGAAGGRVQLRVGRRLGLAWEPQRAGTGNARRRRRAHRPPRAQCLPPSPARPGAAGCGGGPAAAAPGPQRPERPGAACGARGLRALHAPRRAPRQPGGRAAAAAAAARAEPQRGPLPAPGGSMSQADLSTCSAPQTQRIFQEAVRKGNTQELQSLLQNMTNCEFNVNSFGPEGQTALHQSVIDGNLELVKLLVKFGADIRLANRDGWSALHIAAFGGHQDIVLYLITKAKYAGSGR